MKIVDVVGGLGSQMFAYAFSMALKKHYGDSEVLCDFGAYLKHGRKDHNGAELNRIFTINEESSQGVLSFILHSPNLLARLLRRLIRFSIFFKVHTAEQLHYNYDETVFTQRGWVIFRQCWTSWRYFQDVEDKVRETFVFPPLSGAKNLEVVNKMKEGNSVALHVRRGDYVGNKVLGGLIDKSYYVKAIDTITQQVPSAIFFVFSDDVAWCKQHLVQLISERCIFIDWNVGSESYIDMQLMAICKHHIIPNSTFSWWGAYLAQSREQIVVSPKVWANKETGIYLEDMNLPSWHVLDNMSFRNGQND